MARYCNHCGKQISDNAAFCKYCGAKADAAGSGNEAEIKALKKRLTELTGVDMYDPADLHEYDRRRPEEKPERVGGGPYADEKKPKTLAVIRTAAIALIVITAAIGAIIYFGNSVGPVNPVDPVDPVDLVDPDDPGTGEVIDDEDDQDQPAASESEEDPYYHVGYQYTVQTNLRVRAGPGKEYRILERTELAPEDYAKSVDSKTTKDALMEKGSVVTCQGMDGKWMRIESGWICVEDAGEVLVK